MSTKQSWGTVTWFLLHGIFTSMTDQQFIKERHTLIQLVVNICAILPCPECAGHAMQYITKQPIRRIPTRQAMIHYLFTFHNTVNAKLNKPPMSRETHDYLYNHVVIKSVISQFIYIYSQKSRIPRHMMYARDKFQKMEEIKKALMVVVNL